MSITSGRTKKKRAARPSDAETPGSPSSPNHLQVQEHFELSYREEITRRQLVEEKLRRREAELANFVENASIGLHWIGPDGIIQWANRADMELLGYPAEEYIGRHIAEFHADPAVIDAMLARLHCGEVVREAQARLRCKDGSIKTVLIDSSVLWEEGKFIHTQCFTRDVTEQKRAEEALRLSSRLPAENPAPVMRVSRENILHFANPKAQELLSTWNASVGDPAPKAILELIGIGRRRDVEMSLGTRYYTVAVVPAVDGGFVNLYFSEITRRKRAEQALLESEQRLRATFSQAAVGIAIAQLNGRFPESNQKFSEIVGYTAEELTGLSVQDLTHPDDLPKTRENMSRLLKGDVPSYAYEKRFLRKDRALVWILATITVLKDHEGKAQRLIGVVEDITERKRAEVQLRESEERFRLATSAGAVGVWDWDISSNRVSWSDSIYEIHGVGPNEFAGTVEAFAALVHPEDRAMVQSVLERALRGDTPYEVEFRAVRPDGRVIWIYTTARIVRDASGAPVRMLGGTVDITRRKQAELALREREERYELVVTGAEAGIWDWDIPAKRVLFSPRWKQMRGFTEHEVGDNEKEWSDAIHPEDRARVFAAVQAHFEGRTTVFAEEYRVRHKDGHWLWILDRGIAKRDASGRVVCMAGSETDITERKRAEEALRSSEQQLQQVMSLMPAAVYTCDAQGRITFYNRHAVELWGREPKLNDRQETFCACYRVYQLDGTFVPPDQTPMAVAIREGRAFRNVEARVERPDGSMFHASVNIDVLRHAAGEVRGAINVFTDITERKRSEEALRLSEDRFREVLNNSSTIIYVKDTEGKYLMINRSYEELFQITERQLLGRTDLDLFAPEVAGQFRENDLTVIQSGKPLEFEEAAPHADGVHTYISVKFPLRKSDGTVYAVAGISTDITERKRAQENAARLAAIVENSDDGIVSTDLAGIIRSWNRGAERLYGYEAEEAISRSISMLNPQARQEEESRLLQRIREGETIANYETIRRRKDGTVFNASLTVSPVKNSKGTVVGASNVARDISDKVRAREILEETVAERTASLREAVAQMEEFSYSVSHDLRAPLRAMSAYAGVLLEDYGGRLDDTGRGYLEKIQRGSDRMNRLTQDVLSYSRIARAQVQLEPIALEKLVKDILHQYSYLQVPAAEIEIVSPLLDVLGHETSFGQCVANLLNNAVKFVPPGIRPQVRIRTERLAKNTRIWFEDNGIGIRPEHQERIFQMFERVHPDGKYEGTGIGLTIVRKAVEKMGGKVGVESDGQNGSRFWIELRSADK